MREYKLTEDEVGTLVDALRVAYEAENRVDVGEAHEAYTWIIGDRNVAVMCRDYQAGEQQLCDYHARVAEIEYPQGWRGYPGDICRHGMYTGGSGVDWMCGPCEMGDYDDE